MKTCTSDTKDLYFKLMLFFWLTFYLSKDPEKKKQFSTLIIIRHFWRIIWLWRLE